MNAKEQEGNPGPLVPTLCEPQELVKITRLHRFGSLMCAIESVNEKENNRFGNLNETPFNHPFYRDESAICPLQRKRSAVNLEHPPLAGLLS